MWTRTGQRRSSRLDHLPLLRLRQSQGHFFRLRRRRHLCTTRALSSPWPDRFSPTDRRSRRGGSRCLSPRGLVLTMRKWNRCPVAAAAAATTAADLGLKSSSSFSSSALTRRGRRRRLLELTRSLSYSFELKVETRPACLPLWREPTTLLKCLSALPSLRVSVREKNGSTKRRSLASCSLPHSLTTRTLHRSRSLLLFARPIRML